MRKRAEVRGSNFRKSLISLKRECFAEVPRHFRKSLKNQRKCWRECVPHTPPTLPRPFGRARKRRFERLTERRTRP